MGEHIRLLLFLGLLTVTQAATGTTTTQTTTTSATTPSSTQATTSTTSTIAASPSGGNTINPTQAPSSTTAATPNSGAGNSGSPSAAPSGGSPSSAAPASVSPSSAAPASVSPSSSAPSTTPEPDVCFSFTCTNRSDTCLTDAINNNQSAITCPRNDKFCKIARTEKKDGNYTIKAECVEKLCEFQQQNTNAGEVTSKCCDSNRCNIESNLHADNSANILGRGSLPYILMAVATVMSLLQ